MDAEPGNALQPAPQVEGATAIVPATIAAQGDRASERFFTFFTDTIRNKNARAAYYRNALRFFAWAERRGLLPAIKS